MTGEKIVTVFGSSRPKAGDADYEEARELGKLLAKCGFAVCSGGVGGGVGGGFRRGKKGGGGKHKGGRGGFLGPREPAGGTGGGREPRGGTRLCDGGAG